MRRTIDVGVAGEACIPARIKLVCCAYHQAVISYSITPVFHSIRDVKLHETFWPVGKDSDSSLLGSCLSVSAVNSGKLRHGSQMIQ